MLEQVSKFAKLQRTGRLNPVEMKAHLQAYKGDFDQMATTLTQGGLAAVAGKIFTSLKMFKKAKEFYASKSGDGGDDFSTTGRSSEPNPEMKKLYIEEAKWKLNNNEFKAAAQLFM